MSQTNKCSDFTWHGKVIAQLLSNKALLSTKLMENQSKEEAFIEKLVSHIGLILKNDNTLEKNALKIQALV